MRPRDPDPLWRLDELERVGETRPIGGEASKVRPAVVVVVPYRIVVRGRSRRHNFHLTGPGTNRSTQVGRTGTVTWNVTLRSGTYRYQSDPQARRLRRNVLVR